MMLLILNELNEKINVSILFCGEELIQKLNFEFRKKNKPTDVLSFVYGESLIPDDKESFYGEIIICPAVAKKQLEQFNTDFNTEIKRLLIHGVLHLIGYNHEVSKENEEKMYLKQEMLLSKVEDFVVC